MSVEKSMFSDELPVSDRGADFFRDPEPDSQAKRLEAEITRCLTGAVDLPVDVPRFGVTLYGASAQRRSLGLIFGFEDPFFEVRFRNRPGGLPDYEIEFTGDKHTRAEAIAQTIGARLTKALTVDRWQLAWQASRALKSIPAGIPITHFRQRVAGSRSGLVRTGYRCNQDCSMCWQGRDWPGFPPEQIKTWIEDLRRAGCEHLLVSGGEPLIDRHIFEYLEFAAGIGFSKILLETNAIQLAKPGVAERLQEILPTIEIFVSLHSGDAETSDRITNAPGTFVRTVAGIKAAMAAGLRVGFNAVISTLSLPTMADLPRFVRSEFGDGGMQLTISFVFEPFQADLYEELTPDPSWVREVLPKVIDSAAELDMPIRIDGPCGPPLCAFAADERATFLEAIEETLPWRTYLPGCDDCRVRYACFGVREKNAERFGDKCIAPIR